MLHNHALIQIGFVLRQYIIDINYVIVAFMWLARAHVEAYQAVMRGIFLCAVKYGEHSEVSWLGASTGTHPILFLWLLQILRHFSQSIMVMAS